MATANATATTTTSTVVSANRSPYAKLGMRTAPYTSVTPIAFSAITAPLESPIARIWSMISAQLVVPQFIVFLLAETPSCAIILTALVVRM